MSTPYEPLLKEARDWADLALHERWLSPQAVKILTDLEQQSPASLFSGDLDRPLVAAFFGGTGVGKSTLLNRLAGQPIARTGVERPTSREISLYLHDSIPRLNLPEGCPVEQVRMARHQNATRRHVMWVDMPDIDSIEERNRELVLTWLPYVDVVIYVVSPERYRDDQGWRMLHRHGSHHAWLFAINQWDRGHEVQYQDFQQLLTRAGFTDPIILRTDSREMDEARKADDFERLQNLLNELTERHVLSQLESRADHLRMEALAHCLQQLLERLGDHEGYRGLESFFSSQWLATRQSMRKGLEWPMRTVAREFVGREASPVKRRLKLLPVEKPEQESTQTAVKPVTGMTLWDDWTDSQFRDVLDQLIVEAGRQGLAVVPLRLALDDLSRRVDRLFLGEAQSGLRHALIRPGHAVQRIFLGVAGFFAIALPRAALGWVSWQVVEGYYHSTQDQVAWLGTDFAIHSSFLIALAWLVPYFLYRSLTPSAERSAVRGLRAGVEMAFDKIENDVLEVLNHLEHKRRNLREAGQQILLQTGSGKAVPTHPEQSLLGRVLPGRK